MKPESQRNPQMGKRDGLTRPSNEDRRPGTLSAALVLAVWTQAGDSAHLLKAVVLEMRL